MTQIINHAANVIPRVLVKEKKTLADSKTSRARTQVAVSKVAKEKTPFLGRQIETDDAA